MKQTIVSSMLILVLAFVINFNRCDFIDIFISLSFMSNIYIWRIYNFFLMLKFIGVISFSILIDFLWVVIKIIHYTSNLSGSEKKIRILWVVLTIAQIALKSFFSIYLYNLSKQSKSENFL